MTGATPASGAATDSAPKGSQPPTTANTGNQLPWTWQFVVAAVLLVAFAVLTGFMLSWADSPDGVWKNQVFVFSSVEALVFTAVGWIFGKEVHRQRAAEAKEDADRAKTEAKEQQQLAASNADIAADERAKGMRLAGAVETFAAGGTAGAGGHARDVGLDDTTASSQLASLRALVDRLYSP